MALFTRLTVYTGMTRIGVAEWLDQLVIHEKLCIVVLKRMRPKKNDGRYRQQMYIKTDFSSPWMEKRTTTTSFFHSTNSLTFYSSLPSIDYSFYTIL